MTEVRRRRRDADDGDEARDDEPRASRYRDEDPDEDDTPRAARRRNREAFDEGASEGRGEEPRRSRRRDADDDEEERPRRRPAADDDDDAPPRRRAARDDDDEPEEKPRRRAARDDDDDDPPRRKSRDDDDDEPPARRRRAAVDDDDEPESGPAVRSGFKGYRQTRESSGALSDRFKTGEEAVLVAFLEDEPVATWNVHWVGPAGKGKPYNCIEQDCPLCDAGHSSMSMALWNVVQLTGKKPKVQPFEAGPQVTSILEKKNAARSGPLSKYYYSIARYKEGGNGPWKHDIEVVRPRQVQEEWGYEPLTDAELDALYTKAAGTDYVKFPSRKELREVAKDLKD